MAESLEIRPLERLRATFSIGIPLAGIACGITLMYLSMRAVLLVGGFCAEGGPYEISQHCPKGVVGFMFGGVWGGLILAGVYVWQTSKHHVPTLIYLAWPALFLSLGWNFLYFGLNPPIGDGVAWGWLICAIAFALMGGIPLLAIKPMLRPFFSDDVERKPPPDHPFGPHPLAAVKIVEDKLLRSTPSSSVAGTTTMDHQTKLLVADQLERLAALRRSGDIDETEFETAKRRVLS